MTVAPNISSSDVKTEERDALITTNSSLSLSSSSSSSFPQSFINSDRSHRYSLHQSARGGGGSATGAGVAAPQSTESSGAGVEGGHHLPAGQTLEISSVGGGGGIRRQFRGREEYEEVVEEEKSGREIKRSRLDNDDDELRGT